MVLNQENRDRLLAVLKKTDSSTAATPEGAGPPEECRIWLEQVNQQEQTLTVSGTDVPVRVIISSAKDRAAGCPVHINLHGGGFAAPHGEDDDLYCAHLAAGIKGIVVDVDYAPAADHPFPVPLEQAYGVTRWALEQCPVWNADEKKVSVGGQGSGGALAAAVTLRAAQTGDFRLCLQVLSCAALDFSAEPSEYPNQSVQPFIAERWRAERELYLDGDPYLAKMPYVSPAMATDKMLRGVADTVIVSAAGCPFSRTDELYGRRIAALGGTVTMRRFLNSRHGFVTERTDEWKQAQAFIIRAISGAAL